MSILTDKIEQRLAERQARPQHLRRAPRPAPQRPAAPPREPEPDPIPFIAPPRAELEAYANNGFGGQMEVALDRMKANHARRVDLARRLLPADYARAVEATWQATAWQQEAVAALNSTAKIDAAEQALIQLACTRRDLAHSRAELDAVNAKLDSPDAADLDKFEAADLLNKRSALPRRIAKLERELPEQAEKVKAAADGLDLDAIRQHLIQRVGVQPGGYYPQDGDLYRLSAEGYFAD